MKQINQLLISICIAFSICSSVSAQGGTSFETAVQATFDTNNIADASVTDQYYYFTPDFNGYVAIGNCGLTDIVPDLRIYDSLEDPISGKYYYCSYQTHTVIPVDSSMRYYIRWTHYEDEELLTYNWYLTEYDPEPGEFFQFAIPVEINDTIELSPTNNSTETWYTLQADKNNMITISNCGFGNEKWDINLIGVYKDTVKEYYTPDWIIWDSNCSDGISLDFPADSGCLYYIHLYHLNDITAKWTMYERDFTAGEICDSSIQVDKGVTYVVPSEKNGYWYKYTPAENECKVIGSIEGEEQFAALFIKEDCDCDPDYYVTSGCIATSESGIALLLEAGKTYYIGWKNYEYTDIIWSIYDPVDIVYFTVENQVGATEIDHINHTINITVIKNTSVADLTQYFIRAEGVDFIVNGAFQYSGSEQDFTNPLTYTVRYIDHDNNITLAQDWIVTVTIEEAPSGPYTVKSNYLKNPDLAKSLVSNFADFWKTAYDTEYGGFFSYVDREGNPTDDIKTIISQTQDAYAFARAFMITGDTAYLNYADKALQFMYDYYWDETNGGWYVNVGANGDLIKSDGYNTNKYSFFQHYANIGIIAMADATGGVRFKNQETSGNAFNENMHWEMLNNSLDVIDENLWDDRPDYYGYYYEADLDWSNPHDKGFTPTVDGITLHALYSYLLTKDPFFYTRLEQLANDIEEHMIPQMESTEIGFPENYNSDWGEPSGSFFIGHMFKTAWCLARAYVVNPQEKYREAAKALMYDLMDNGAYDYVYGAPYSAFDCYNGWVDTGYKLFWEAEQAYTSGMMNYYISNNEDDKYRFIEVADGTLDFFMNNFVDTEYGEVYEKTDREGNPNLIKGHYDKAGYHSTELAYYTYLYGNLFYKKEPVELYYFIDASDEAQTVSLYPLAIEDNYLKIDAVELNGNAFNTYDKDTRTLNMAANEGGIFKVTFINTKPVTGIDEPDIDNSLDVNVYPNPIISSGIIEYTIEEYTDVTIHIIDITGKVIHTVENKNVSPGIYREIINREDFNKDNIYFLQVKTNTQSNIIKLIIMD